MDSDSSYTDLLKRDNFLSLSAYRIRNLAMEMFKCSHGMNPMYLNNLFCKQEIKYNLRDKPLLEQPRFSTKKYGYRSFRYYGSKLWNALPFEITNTDNYNDFKLKLTTWCHSSDLDKLEIYWFWIYRALSISRGNFSPRTPHSSPARARYMGCLLWVQDLNKDFNCLLLVFMFEFALYFSAIYWE